MKYKVSKQYAQDREKLIAEFHNFDDANFFIKRKILSDAEKNLTLIYRLFEDQKLLKQHNKEKIHAFIRPGEYAQGDQYIPDSFGHYKISASNLETQSHAAFTELSDAELFVEDKLTHSDAIVTYYIFNNDKLIAELNQRVKKQTGSEGGQGKGQTASIRPTPFNTSPSPFNMPLISVTDEKTDKK